MPPGEALRERSPAHRSQPVPDPGAEYVSDRTRERHRPELEPSGRHEITRERHDDLAGERNACALDGHANDDARVSPSRDDGEDERGDRLEDGFEQGHDLGSEERG